jgi:HD-like signal output (HDOD) protein/CheY-like chemotaxis protein
LNNKNNGIMKKRIIFVDDEQSLLDGLRRSLRQQRDVWDMSFTTSGQEALKMMETEPYDALITDMRMPGMSGVELLSIVATRYPQMVRIILSGQSSQDLTLKSVMLAHQYLSKPSDKGQLESALQRAFNLQETLGNESLRSLVTGIRTLPVLPAVYTEITQQLSNENTSLRTIGTTIGKDPAMTAKILQLVNSAFFGLGRHVADPAEAATLLGLETIRNLVLSVGIFSQFKADTHKIPGFSLAALWDHCNWVGMYARLIAIAEDAEPMLQEECLLSGLLHDLGVLVLIANLPREYAEASKIAIQQKIPLHEAERERFGATHAELGAYLLSLWGFSDPVVEAIAFHHTPSLAPPHPFSPLTAVHVANALASHVTPGESDTIDLEYLQRIDLRGHLATWEQLGIEQPKEPDKESQTDEDLSQN